MIALAPTIAGNSRQLRDRIAAAAIGAGRKPEDVTLVAVSKTRPVEAVQAALAAGQMARLSDAPERSAFVLVAPPALNTD
jgi:hypothetical protein